MAVWYSLCSFGIVFQFGYVLTKKNLATLFRTEKLRQRVRFFSSSDFAFFKRVLQKDFDNL
jgi:hypothetical protein